MSSVEKNTGRTVWRVLLAVCALILAAAVIRRLMKPEEELVTTPLSTVSTGYPERGDIEIETSLVGTMMPGDVYYVIPKVAGEIREIFVEQGDMVNEGDPICTIDNQKQIDAAKISLDSAEVQVRTMTDSVQTAKKSLDRMAALLQSGDVSSQVYEQTKSAYDQANAGLEAAKLQLEGARLQYDTQVEFSTVTAPVSGKIESTEMEQNALASQQNPLCIITGESANKVQFYVTDRLLSAFSTGSGLRVEKQGESYEGTVISVAGMPSQTTGLYLIEASVEDGGVIPQGASVKVYFPSEWSEDALLLNTDAVYYDGGKTYVYTAEYDETAELSEETTISEENKAATVHKIEVETGLSDGEKTEIISGITEEDRVILSWTAQLYEGAKVQALPEEA